MRAFQFYSIIMSLLEGFWSHFMTLFCRVKSVLRYTRQLKEAVFVQISVVFFHVLLHHGAWFRWSLWKVREWKCRVKKKTLASDTTPWKQFQEQSFFGDIFCDVLFYSCACNQHFLLNFIFLDVQKEWSEGWPPFQRAHKACWSLIFQSSKACLSFGTKKNSFLTWANSCHQWRFIAHKASCCCNRAQVYHWQRFNGFSHGSNVNFFIPAVCVGVCHGKGPQAQKDFFCCLTHVWSSSLTAILHLLHNSIPVTFHAKNHCFQGEENYIFGHKGQVLRLCAPEGVGMQVREGGAGADPGFWSGRPSGVLTLGGLSPKFAQICPKTVWFWKNLGGTGAGPPKPPGSASGVTHQWRVTRQRGWHTCGEGVTDQHAMRVVKSRGWEGKGLVEPGPLQNNFAPFSKAVRWLSLRVKEATKSSSPTPYPLRHNGYFSHTKNPSNSSFQTTNLFYCSMHESIN